MVLVTPTIDNKSEADSLEAPPFSARTVCILDRKTMKTRSNCVAKRTNTCEEHEGYEESHESQEGRDANEDERCRLEERKVHHGQQGTACGIGQTAAAARLLTRDVGHLAAKKNQISTGNQ